MVYGFSLTNDHLVVQANVVRIVAMTRPLTTEVNDTETLFGAALGR